MASTYPIIETIFPQYFRLPQYFQNVMNLRIVKIVLSVHNANPKI